MQNKRAVFPASHHHAGTGRLLLVQLALMMVCLWIGIAIHEMQTAATAQVVLLLAVPVLTGLAFFPAGRRWIGALALAGGLMVLLTQLLPVAWLQGPLYILAVLACAALAVVMARPPRRQT